MARNTPDELLREIVLDAATPMELVKGQVGDRTIQFLEWLANIPDWERRDVDDLRMLYHAHLYRLAQAHKIVSVFVHAHKRPPRDSAELEAWLASADAKAALAPHTGPDGKIVP